MWHHGRRCVLPKIPGGSTGSSAVMSQIRLVKWHLLDVVPVNNCNPNLFGLREFNSRSCLDVLHKHVNGHPIGKLYIQSLEIGDCSPACETQSPSFIGILKVSKDPGNFHTHCPTPAITVP